ncbi:MAG: hypothetical protein HFI70_17175 [Lachnospiraceae bacterium]|nr:hypothetical protein [Lachnospiraceae bacterium]MCI9560186.1 hypothetical protein [Lachnospiraceae bacterium]NBH35604.1 hypothetical protein [Clostridiaceae bacterium]
MDDLVNLVTLADGSKIILQDEDDITLSLVSNDKIKDIFQFPCPSGGYGGGSLLLSPSEKYVIFSYFSGESEEGFALFEIVDYQFKFLYDSDYLYGEYANYGFTDNEKILIQTFRTGSWYKENAETDENGDMYYTFGELNLLTLETFSLDRHTILVYPSDDWKEEKTDVGTFLFTDIVNGMLRVEMPWGNETFQYPLQETLVIRFSK